MNKDFLRKIYTTNIVSSFVNLLGKPWKGNGSILMYHRVLPDEKINEDLDVGLAVLTSNFEKQIKLLKTNYNIVPIDELINNLKSKRKEKFLLSITFDDGYKDNLNFALPILEHYKIPATIYVTTRFLDTEVWMWWYELKEIINQKDYLKFNYKEHNYYYKLKNYRQKIQAFKNLRKLFLNLRVNEQLELLEIATENKKRKNYSKICLDSKDLKTLDKNSLITIGAHTHTHTNLKILNKDEAINDICKCTKILENLLDHKVKHFAYPYGGLGQADIREYDIIKNLSFSSAVTDRVYPIKDDNLFSLPRIGVGKNANEKEINNHLTGFYNLAVKFM